MTTNPININTVNNSGTTTTSSLQDINPFGLVTESLALQELLKHLREELQALQQTQSDDDASSTPSDTEELSVGTSSTISNSSTSSTPGTMTLAQIIANVTLLVANVQGQLAKVQQEIAEGNISIQNSNLQRSQDGFDAWKKNMEEQAEAEANKSKWQKFCDSFSDAMKTVCEYADKWVPVLALANKIEDDVFGGHFGLSEAYSYAGKGMDYINEGIGYAISHAADFLSGGDPKLKIAMEVFLSVALAVAASAAPGALSGLVSLASDVMESVSAAEFISADAAAVANVAGAANEIEMADFSIGGARAGAQAAGEIGNVANVAEEASSASTNLLSRAWNAVSNLSRPQSLALFTFVRSLQDSSFASDVADRIGSDKGKMAWNIIFNVSAGLIASAAGFQLIGASLPSGLFTNMFELTQKLQMATSMVQSYGNLQVGLIDLNLADLQASLGEIEAGIKANEGYAGISSTTINSSQSGFRSSMDAESSIIQMLAKAIPVESKATADVINSLKQDL
jgi:hypothetical protein